MGHKTDVILQRSETPAQKIHSSADREMQKHSVEIQINSALQNRR